MSETNAAFRRNKQKNPWWFFLWGLLLGLLLAVLAAGVILGLSLLRARAQNTAFINEAPDAYVQLSVAADGCGVTRGEMSGATAVNGLTWVIEDADGFAVLERGAENEYRYRYFATGHYTVHIKAWYNGLYYIISNEVEIDC